MRKLIAIVTLVLVTIVVYLIDKPIGSLPALGRLLDPVNGAMAAAEPVNTNFSRQIHNSSLSAETKVFFDELMVPHIEAANDHDLYFMQGFLHASFRLWQMDMQTRAAAGRISEVVGEKAFAFDRRQRRKGMVYGAENSLKEMEADPRTKQMLDAYTAGINDYIQSLKYRDYPVEYKLMGFAPESWTNLKSALLLKYMADDLTGETDDIPLTLLRDALSPEEFAKLYPERIAGVNTVIPHDTIIQHGSLAIPAAPADSIAFAHLSSADFEKAEAGKGSNNWALSGSRTKSGAAILCNDPHLGLNLPSLWYEIQLTAPGINAYGVSLPGAPGIIIGFTDNISWGFTNNYRDVKDFYAIQPSADGKTYLFNGAQIPFTYRYEKISIRNKPDFIDTVRYTVHGPLYYDEHHHGKEGISKPLAMCWMAHRPSNELLAVYLMNRSNDYTQFTNAIQYFHCPAQNMIFSDKKGDIALWGQGQFINKWKEQGRYVMNGTDSSTLWEQEIPTTENPHSLNPAQGYLASANQTITDTTYPYWYNGSFYEFRAWRINNVLKHTSGATVNDMFALQNDVYSVLAANVLPVMLVNTNPALLNNRERAYLEYFGNWDYKLTAESKAATVFQVWWANFYDLLWKDMQSNMPVKLLPSPERTMQLLKDRDPILGNIADIAVNSLKNASDSLEKLRVAGKLEWYHAKNTSVKHLTKLPAFSFADLKIGGWGNVVNAAKGDHGPSWRMVVQMSKEIEAYGVYPGGQSGNPGSKYYNTFLDKWVKGEYYKLNFYTSASKDKTVKYTLVVKPK